MTNLHIHHHRLTAQTRSVLQRMARAGHPPLHTLSLAAARAAYEAGSGVLVVDRAALARVEDFHIPARDGHGMPARLYAPSEATGLPVLLYLHGGGFTIGSIATHDVLCRELARLSGGMVVSLEYRLAPEHRFPVASNDAWDALAWLAAHADTLGADRARLAVGGDSAGGTLAAVNAILARDAGVPLALQLLFYPGCAAHQDTPSHATYARGLVLEEPAIRWFLATTSPRTPSARTGASHRCMRTTWTAWRRPGWVWPNATRWWTKAFSTPTSCVRQVWRWTWRSTAA